MKIDTQSKLKTISKQSKCNMLAIDTISVVLVSKDGYYIGKEWQLPKRFEWDKEFITNLAKNRVVLASENTIRSLPESILKSAKAFTTSIFADYDINFWIGTFETLADMFIIIESEEKLNGWKEFHFNVIDEFYEPIMDMNGIKIFFRKK